MLQYFRDKKKEPRFPAIFWPVALPWGGLLSVMAMFLNITSHPWEPIVGLAVEAAWKSDPSARPLAVLRMRAGRAASLFYHRADRPPQEREALVRKDFAVIPAPPLPAHLRRLAEKWTLIENESERDDTFVPDFLVRPACRTRPDAREAFFPGAAARKPDCQPDAARPSRSPSRPRSRPPTLLIAKEYRSAIDWNGIRQGLLEARAVGIASTLVYVEAEDEAQVEAILGAIDLCMTLRLRPILRLQ